MAIDLFSEATAPAFDDPLGMLLACHRRIERQLATLARLQRHLPEHGCDVDARAAARGILRYFDTAAPSHHADEEVSVFPRLRGAVPGRADMLVADLERRVGELEVRSPIDGMVGSVSVTEKAAVQQDTVLMNVVDLSAFEVEFRVAESYAGAIGIGMPAEISYAGRSYPGDVTSISPEVRQSEVTGRVRFAGEMPAGLRQNQRVAVRILMDRRDGVLKLERGAFYESGGGTSAYVVRDGVAERRAIRTGAVSVREVEVLDGLAEGDQVVISNTDDFRNAARVLLAD